MEASSVRFAVVDEASIAQLFKRGAWMAGHRCIVEAFEEAQPDAICSQCCGWGDGGTSEPSVRGLTG